MSKVDREEFATLVEEVLGRLSRDSEAKHLWHWRSRPGCADDPIGPSRRSHLTTLLGLLGGSALAGLSTACRDNKKVSSECGDDPCASDAGRDSAKDAAEDDAGGCGDDPCACADDPCACADDPC